MSKCLYSWHEIKQNTLKLYRFYLMSNLVEFKLRDKYFSASIIGFSTLHDTELKIVF